MADKKGKQSEHSSNVKDERKPSISSTVKFTGSSSVSPIVGRHKHSVSVKVGASLIKFIKGHGGSTQKKIEEETGVTILLPSSWREDSIVIEGASAESVAKASARIQDIIDQAVNSPSVQYSHFVSLPLATYPELVAELNAFQNSILGGLEGNVNLTNAPQVPTSSNPSARYDSGIERSIFINPRTFHLTVVMLKLWNKERADLAARVLQNILPKVMEALDNRPISIRLQGLDCMRGTVEKAYVVHAPVEEIGGAGRLLRACQVIIDSFDKAGLVLKSDANRSLKLHATLMNAKHRKRTEYKRMSDSFDARSVFQRFGTKNWGTYVIREAHLSQRFKYDEYGYYHRCASISFPN